MDVFIVVALARIAPIGHIHAAIRPIAQLQSAKPGVARLQEAHSRGKLAQELVKLRRYGLLIVDEVGYIPFDQDAANLFFQLVSSRYEHASMILTSNLPFARWGDVFGDLTIASAMIDRIVHHAEVISLKGNSYRLKKHQPAASTPSRPP